ncbi:MAG: hypothetical protein QOD77_1600 [Thermoplasmata archaeon]|jgi:hypothetical protein|nr:hypothetical protein [Thermoplasmata archaeon]
MRTLPAAALLLALVLAPAASQAEGGAPQPLPFPLQSPAIASDGHTAWLAGGATHDTILPYTLDGGPGTPMRLREAREAPALFWTGTVLLVAGGARGASHSNTIEAIDPATGRSTLQAAALPEGVSWAAHAWMPAGSACAQGCGYLFGGLTATGPSDRILRYDEALGRVESMEARLPFPCAKGQAVWMGTVFLVAGCMPVPGRPDTCPASILAYAPQRDAATYAASEATLPAYGAALLGHDGRLLALGGTDCKTGAAAATAIAFDPGTGAFEPLAPLAEPRAQAVAADLDGTVLAFGGGTAAVSAWPGTGAQRTEPAPWGGPALAMGSLAVAAGARRWRAFSPRRRRCPSWPTRGRRPSTAGTRPRSTP